MPNRPGAHSVNICTPFQVPDDLPKLFLADGFDADKVPA